MKYLEIIYNNETGKILTTKIHGKMDTVIPIHHSMKIIPFIKEMRNDIDKKLFNGIEFINNPTYIEPIDKKVEFTKMKNVAEQIQFIAKELKLIEEK